MLKISARRHLTSLTFVALCLLSSQSMAEEGIAAYYANKYHGRTTASGAIYDKNKLTAAHRTLKFGTQVKVTDLNNHKSVIVTINDRGPFIKKRIIDLSYAAAQKLDLLKAGLSKVRLEIIQ